MEDTSEGVYITKEEEVEGEQIRSLTDSIVFCPKCGCENFFADDPIITQHFCKKCHVNLNEIWDNYFEGILTVNECLKCQQYTFEKFRYCIACGKTRIERKVSTKKNSSRQFGKTLTAILTFLYGGEDSVLNKIPTWIKVIIIICLLAGLIACIIFIADFLQS